MDMINHGRNNSINLVKKNLNNRLSKKLPNIKINFNKEEHNSENFNEKENVFHNENETLSIEENKIKVIKLIILDEKNNILTKKYKLIVNLNKNIIKLPFNLEPYKINFVSINDLSKQILNKLKTNDSNDINHYENLCFTSSVVFYDESFKNRLTDHDIVDDINDILICKLEILKAENGESSNRNKYSDLNIAKSKFKKNQDLEMYSTTPLNNKCFTAKKNSENNLNQSSNKNKNSPSKINKEYQNRNISLNDYVNEEEKYYLQKLKNHELEINNKNSRLYEDNNNNNNNKREHYVSKDTNKNDYPNSRNKENHLNKSDSDSYTLTNRSFYNKIKPKNVEILIRDSAKKLRHYDKLSDKSILGFSAETLDFKFQLPENFSKYNRNSPNNFFPLEKPKNRSFNSENKSLVKSENNFHAKKNKENHFKTKSTYSNLINDTVENLTDSIKSKLPTILSKSSKFEEFGKAAKNLKIIDKPKFNNLFDNKKEPKTLIKISLLTKNKLTNEKTQFKLKDALEFSNNLNTNSNDDVFLPNINHIKNKSVIFNSLYKSFQDSKFKTNDLKNKTKYNLRFSLSEIENDKLFMKKTNNSNNYNQNSPNEGISIKNKSFRTGKIYPARSLIKSIEKTEEDDVNNYFSDLKTSSQFLNSNEDIKIRTLKKLYYFNSPNDNSRSNSIKIRKSFDSLGKRVKKPNKQMLLNKKIKILQNILEIDNKENLNNNKNDRSVSPDKDRINIDEFNENFECEIKLTDRSSNKRLSNNSIVNRLSENKKHKILLSNKLNKNSNSNLKIEDSESKKRHENVFSLNNKNKFSKNRNSGNENIPNNLSVSESTSYMNKSINSDYEGEIKLGTKREVCSETENNKFAKVSFDNKNSNNVNCEKNRNNLNHSSNFSCGVNLNEKEEKNYDDYYVNLYEETQKLKFKIDNFIKNDITKLVGNELLEEKFKGIAFHEKSEFDYQTKREFLFYAFISSKFEERINFKKSSRGNFSLPVPGGEYKIVHTGISTISIKIIKNESEINYDFYRKSKNSYLKLIQEYNQVLEDILNKVRKNITEIIRYFSNLNCLKINKTCIDFHFAFLFILRNENIFSNKKIVFKLLEFLTKDNDHTVNYHIFYGLKKFSLENIDKLTKEKYFKHVNFIRFFLKFYLGDEKQKDNITRIIDEIKYSLGVNDFDLSVLISEDISDLTKNADIYNIRLKVGNIYLSLLKLLA